MSVSQELQEKVEATQANSTVAAQESVRTNEILLSDRTNKKLTWVATICIVGVIWWGAATWCADQRSGQVQLGVTVESHGKRLNDIDDRLNKIDSKMATVQERTTNIRSDTSHMRDIIENWQNGPLQPVRGAHVGAR